MRRTSIATFTLRGRSPNRDPSKISDADFLAEFARFEFTDYRQRPVFFASSITRALRALA
jgi:hypothetical protein